MIRNTLRRFRRSEDGSATIQVVMMLPVFLTFFLSSFELGMLLTRQMMLDRAMDLTVREVRLGHVTTVTEEAMHSALKTMICDTIGIMPDCSRLLRLEMLRIDPRNWNTPSTRAPCIDTKAENEPVIELTIGGSNEMMLLRACALFDPYFPTTGLASKLERESGDLYALLSSSAYVVEPN